MIYLLQDLQTAEFRKLGAKDKQRRKRRAAIELAARGAGTTISGAALGSITQAGDLNENYGRVAHLAAKKRAKRLNLQIAKINPLNSRAFKEYGMILRNPYSRNAVGEKALKRVEPIVERFGRMRQIRGALIGAGVGAGLVGLRAIAKRSRDRRKQ